MPVGNLRKFMEAVESLETQQKWDALHDHYEEIFPRVAQLYRVFDKIVDHVIEHANHDELFEFDWSSDLGGIYYVYPEYAMAMAREAFYEVRLTDDGEPDLKVV